MRILENKRTVVLGILFLFAYFIRLNYISLGPFHYDALDLALCAQQTLETGMLHYEHGTGFPLTVICGAFFILFFRFFGVTDPVFCVNFMSVVAGAVGVLLMFFLVEKLFDFHKAMFSAILLACFPPHVLISTFGKSLTLSIVLSLASACTMLRYTQEGKNKHLIFSAFFLGFCAAARLSDALVVLPIAYLYWSKGRPDYGRIRPFVVFGVIALATAALYYVPMMLEKGIRPFVFVLTSKQQSEFLGPFSFVLQASLDWLLGIFGTEGVLLIVAGFAFMVLKRENRQRYFLYIWFIILHFFYGNISSSGPRYLVIAWLPLLVAQGSFLGSFRKRGFYLSSLVVFFIAFSSFLRYAPVFEFRHRHALQIEFSQWVASKTHPDSVIIAMDEDIFLQYYGKRKTLKRPLTCDKSQIDGFFDTEVDGLMKEGKEVYIISSGLLPYDPCRLFKKKMAERYKLVLIGHKKNEDWHHAFLGQSFFNEKLYRVYPVRKVQ